jgi:hypothetical protein
MKENCCSRVAQTNNASVNLGKDCTEDMKKKASYVWENLSTES